MPILAAILAIIVAVTAGFLATTTAPSGLMIIVSGSLVCLLAFLSPKLSLTLLVFSMLLSPEIGFGAVSGSRSAVLRYDDILLVIIFFCWLARTAIFKHKPFITSTPVQTPMLAYAALAIFSTLLGVLRGDVNFKVSVFYVLKYVEYFLLYFMVVNILDSKEDIKKYLKYAFLVAVLVTVYAYYYYHSAGAGARASAPFEAPIGSPEQSEPASLGGYYLLVFGFLLAMMTEYSGPIFMFALVSMIFMFPAFLMTFSRASYIGFMVLVPALIFISRRRKVLMTFVFCAGLMAAAAIPGLSGKVKDRILMTYQGDYATNTVKLGAAGQVKLEDSAAARVGSLNRVVFKKLPQHPIFGCGVTGVGIGDTQYALVLGEMGLAGLCVFIWMISVVFLTAKKVYRAYEEPWIKALSLGLMASIIGLIFQALGVNNFIIVRIMEPFWFLTALVMVLHRDIGRDIKAETVINV